MINILNKLGMKGNFLNLIKYINEKPTDNIINGEILNNFPLKWEKGKDSHSPISIQNCSGSPNKYRKARKINNRVTKEKYINFVCTDMIVYVQNQRNQ